MQAEQLGNGIADASTSAVFSKRWIPHRTCAKLPPTDASIGRYHPAIDSSAAAWCDRFPAIFIERDRLGEVLIEI
jgi:hypothetical protein